ncbi:MAG: hypothetical protein WCQ82_05680 [Bacteroidaceae bacterium]|nr:hypothetical protein [Bacteroidaceae bacterium]
MSILSKLINKETQLVDQEKSKVEAFMTLIRVYYQAVMAVNLGITNIRMLPDLTTYKHVFKVPTRGGKLGVGEKAHAKKILKENYGMSDNFFKEVDASIRRNCKNMNAVNNFLYMFQGFSNDLMMAVGELLKWKMIIPKFFKGAIRSMIKSTVHQLLTKQDWKKESVIPIARNIRSYQSKLGYTEEWMTEYTFHIMLLAKSEKRKHRQAQ